RQGRGQRASDSTGRRSRASCPTCPIRAAPETGSVRSPIRLLRSPAKRSAQLLTSYNFLVDSDERFEQLIAYLGSQLPSPVEQFEATDGSLIFIGGSPAEVVVQLDEASVVVSEYAVKRKSSVGDTPKPRRVGVLKWRRLSESPLMNALSALIKGARELRV